MRIAAAAFTGKGQSLLRGLCEALREHTVTVFDAKADSARDWAAREFYAADALIFVGAAGIAVRLTAPLIKSKTTDPAVLVVDEFGRYVIPLLSGHLGGANRLALKIASALDAAPVITTATDLNRVFAVDEWAMATGCVIDNPGRIKNISGALLRGEEVGFHSDFPVHGPLPEGLTQNQKTPAGICVSFDAGKQPFAVTLNLIPRIAALGAGCKKNTNADDFERFALKQLARRKVCVKALKVLASVDLKRDEPCFLAFSSKYGAEFVTYAPERLREADGNFSGSRFVSDTIGVDNVCERAAVLSSAGALVMPKTRGIGMTMALAVPDWVCRFPRHREEI